MRTAHKNTVGGVLLGFPVAEVLRICALDNFTPEDQLVLTTAESLTADGRAVDVTTVIERLSGRGHLEAAGGFARLSELARNTPTAENTASYAAAVRDQAVRQTVAQLIEECTGGAELIAGLERELSLLKAGAPPTHNNIILRHVADIVAERREPDWVRGLEDILERGVIAVLAGIRGAFKSLIALRWMLTAGVNGECVVILSAEGSGLDRRVDAHMRTFAPAVDLRKLPILALERAVNLNAAQVLEELCTAIDAAGVKPAVVTIDTLSKFAPGMDENDNTEVAAFLGTLSTGLRNRYGCTVLLVAHAGHNDTKRPRGASALMANPDSEYIVERASSTDMAVTVSRERFNDSPAMPPLAYIAEVVELGRTDRRGKQVTSLALRDADLSTVRASSSGPRRETGKYVSALIAALMERHRALPEKEGLISTVELRQIAGSQKMDRRRYQGTLEKLLEYRWLEPVIGGYRFLAEEPAQ